MQARPDRRIAACFLVASLVVASAIGSAVGCGADVEDAPLQEDCTTPDCVIGPVSSQVVANVTSSQDAGADGNTGQTVGTGTEIVQSTPVVITTGATSGGSVTVTQPGTTTTGGTTTTVTQPGATTGTTISQPGVTAQVGATQSSVTITDTSVPTTPTQVTGPGNGDNGIGTTGTQSIPVVSGVGGVASGLGAVGSSVGGVGSGNQDVGAGAFPTTATPFVPVCPLTPPSNGVFCVPTINTVACSYPPITCFCGASWVCF